MADRGRVTITLGRSGQVVNRNGHASDITHTDSMPLAGMKRSLRDRLGSSGGQLDNKRQRGADDNSYQSAYGNKLMCKQCNCIAIHDKTYTSHSIRKASGSSAGHLPPPGGLVQQCSYRTEEQHTVDGLLSALGLGKYAALLKAEEVDMTALKQMGEKDLKDLGMPMGPRKKILLALAHRLKQQQRQM